MTTVLIVDDHERFRATARRVLERAGFEVVGEAGLGTEAITTTRMLRPPRGGSARRAQPSWHWSPRRDRG